MFEVLVIENNQVNQNLNLNPKPLAMWTEVFDTHSEACDYIAHINDQNMKFEEKYKGKLSWTVFIID